MIFPTVPVTHNGDKDMTFDWKTFGGSLKRDAHSREAPKVDLIGLSLHHHVLLSALLIFLPYITLWAIWRTATPLFRRTCPPQRENERGSQWGQNLRLFSFACKSHVVSLVLQCNDNCEILKLLIRLLVTFLHIIVRVVNRNNNILCKSVPQILFFNTDFRVFVNIYCAKHILPPQTTDCIPVWTNRGRSSYCWPIFLKGCMV